MTTSADIDLLIARTQALLLLLDMLLNSERPEGAQRVLYQATRYYLQVLLVDLTNTRDWLKAVENIQAIIGNDVFTGVNTQDEQIALIRLQTIDTALQNCDQQDIACLVDTAVPYPELNSALKVRIIDAVRERLASTMGNFEYDGRDEQGSALPVLLLNIPFAWDNPLISAQNLFDQVPFRYDRIGAAMHAIQTSRANFEGSYFPFGEATITNPTADADEQQISPTPPLEVGGGLVYNTLRHRGASTGSAYFISEALFFGGHLPMYSQDGDEFDCGDEASLIPPPPLPPRGWLTCCVAQGSNLSATNGWRVHQSLMQYFVASHEASPINIDICDYSATQSCDDVVFGSIGYRNPQGEPGTLLDRYMRFSLDAVGSGNWRPGYEVDGPQYLYELFRIGQLSRLETGDYVFIDVGHGFLIVGWGEAIGGASRLNALENLGFNLIRPRDPNTGIPLNSIPYVADFAYGYNENAERIGWLQDIRPRPFYTSHAMFSDAQLLEQRQRLASDDLDLDDATNFEQRYLQRFQNFGRVNEGVTAYSPFSGQNINQRPNWSFFHFPSIIRIPFPKLYQGALSC